MADCPCPLERKVLIQTMNEIVRILGEDAKRKKACEALHVQPKRCAGDTTLSRVTSECQNLDVAVGDPARNEPSICFFKLEILN
ncbi:DNA polymerase catalytic subunit [Frankliniella fusca]|uniref:DNA polymerase catalytic subunit n=1 Tax=Frankliniella fusca TaxID=407009 RepID=A0AAE1H035_9NEOP|nr:DNA polymerase catalytic subunit [Frankliniella fusca]